MRPITKVLPRLQHSVHKHRSGAPSAGDPWIDVHSPLSVEWDAHWQRQRTSLFGTFCSWYRRQIRARSVARYFETFFPHSGVFAECGSGSSETSCRINIRQRKLIAVDFSTEALARAGLVAQIGECVRANIRELPFKDHSLDGIWNLGVMEHFVEDEQLQVLHEFHRVLKPGGRLMLWWPPRLATDHLLLSPFGWQFPAEPGRVTAKQMKESCEKTGFTEITVTRPWSDCGTECLVRAVASDGNTDPT